MADQHHRRTLAPELTTILGMQTHPYSPTAYVLGMTYFQASHMQLPGLDHPTCWTKKGRRVVISEPYGVSFTMLREMMAFAEFHGLECSVDARFQSWNPGACDAVIWTKKGAPLV